MTPRSIRRAAERKAKKLARKAERLNTAAAAQEEQSLEAEATTILPDVDDLREPGVERAPMPHLPISPARLAANRVEAG